MRSSILKRNMDMMMDRSMLEYDRQQEEKYKNGEAKKFIDARQRRIELEAVDQSLRAKQEAAMQEIRLKEQEEAK